MDGDVMSIIASLTRYLVGEVLSKYEKINLDQILIFTHNIFFHKAIEYYPKNDCLYHRITKVSGVSTITTTDESTVVSNYQQLWIEYGTTNNPVTLFNTMRRILECYFKEMAGEKTYRMCRDNFHGIERIQFENLCSMINSGSHSAWEPVEVSVDENTIETYKGIFKKTFDNANQTGHYEMMMEFSERRTKNKFGRLDRATTAATN